MKRHRTDIETEAVPAETTETLGQRRVREALQGLDVSAPDTLRRAIEQQVEAAQQQPASLRERLRARVGGEPTERQRARSTSSWRLGTRPLALAGGGLATLALALTVVLSDGSDTTTPSVQQASRVALLPNSAPAPAAQADGLKLKASVEGIAYPTWTGKGWTPSGERTDTVDGTRIRTVFYVDPKGWRVGYSIAAGDALPVPQGGRIVLSNGTKLHAIKANGANVVTWRRDGHTCILASKRVPAAKLLKLAGYTTA